MSGIPSFTDHPGIVALLAIHGAALLLWLGGATFRKSGITAASVWVLLLAFLVNTAAIAERWIEAGRPPFKTFFETLLFYPWCVALVTLVLIGLYRLHPLVPFAAAVCMAGLGYALAKPDAEIVSLPPALQSGWFVPHVVVYFVGYASLFAAGALALLAISLPRWRAASGPGFEEYAHRAVMFGFATITLGLVMGGVWAKEAWGDYWSWDPKENWSLITFIAYLVYLHVRAVRGWRGRRAMVVCVLAFATVAFTYLGMNLLPTAEESLHVYTEESR